jgi:hypothetical protein
MRPEAPKGPNDRFGRVSIEVRDRVAHDGAFMHVIDGARTCS